MPLAFRQLITVASILSPHWTSYLRKRERDHLAKFLRAQMRGSNGGQRGIKERIGNEVCNDMRKDRRKKLK